MCKQSQWRDGVHISGDEQRDLTSKRAAEVGNLEEALLTPFNCLLASSIAPSRFLLALERHHIHVSELGVITTVLFIHLHPPHHQVAEKVLHVILHSADNVNNERSLPHPPSDPPQT